ncbi:MAG: DUF3592 domain-containing protein [Acetatifactor sp.]|nr:DUF3592 domain-containing protein [Acetatifactor sp.]
MKMTNWYMVSTGRIKSKKECTKKITATITETCDAGVINQDTERGEKTQAYYEFFVNGIKYVGVDEIFGLPFNNQTVMVFYDPEDPSNNCTKFGKGQDNGSNYVKAVLITLGVIAAIVFFIILVAILLGSGRRLETC